jgi:DNA-binding response OmpR family regulator
VGSSARILVIDDEALIGKAVARMLAEHDVHVVTAPDAGIARALQESWDMVLVDMNIPPSSGEAI